MHNSTKKYWIHSISEWTKKMKNKNTKKYVQDSEKFKNQISKSTKTTNITGTNEVMKVLMNNIYL